MIKGSETRHYGSYEGKSLATLHCNNVGKSLLGIVAMCNVKVGLLQCQVARDLPS